MDSILTQNLKIKSEESESILKFLEIYVDTVIHVMNYVIDKLPEVSLL